MKAITTGLISLFTAAPGGVHNDFWTDVNGRLFDTLAPDKTPMPYAIYLFVSDVDQDSFTENMKEIHIQFSLFSDSGSSAQIKDMDTHLTAMLKDKVFTVTGWTVETTRRVNGNGPYLTPADLEAGTGKYWQTDIDFELVVNKT